MRGHGFAAVGTALAILAFAAAPASAQPLTAEEITANPAMSAPVLSPSGRYIALVAWEGEDNSILVYDTENRGAHPIYKGTFRDHFGGSYPEWAVWKTDERLLIGLRVLELERRRDDPEGAIRSFRHGRAVMTMRRDGSDPVKVEAPRARPGFPGTVLDTLPANPDEILMVFSDAGNVPSVARVNILTGESEEILQGHRRVLNYYTDRQGQIIGRSVLRGMTGRIMVMEGRDLATGRWSELFRIRRDEIREFADYEFLGSTQSPAELYVSVRGDAAAAESTAAVRVLDFRTRQLGPVLYRHSRYDVSDVVISDDGVFMAGCYWADALECDFTDAADQAVYRGLKRFFGAERSLSILSQSDDGKIWLIEASGPQNPGDYYVYDSEARHAEPLGPRFPGLPEERLAPTRRLDYAAADGQALWGYLTAPADAEGAAPAPLIVMPHGGPELRDAYSFDPLVQALVSRGYQVFQPDFRGSSGRGRAFAEAGHRQWGGVMQDDVYAGLAHLTSQGLADPEKVCIVGASYGGYVAAWAAATRPELFRCAVPIAGVTDLVDVMRWERREAGADSDRYDYWVKSIGDPRADEAALRAASPVTRAAVWRTPILLIHGEDDDIVPVDQSRDLNRALERAGKPVRLVVLEDEGHSGWSTESWTTLLAELDAFLGRHLTATPLSPQTATTGPDAAPGA